MPTDSISVAQPAGGNLKPIATEFSGSIYYQLVKLVTGASGVNNLVSTTHPMPISDSGGSLTVDGTVSINALPTGSNTIGSVVIAAGAAAIGSVTITGTVAATQSGTWIIDLPTGAANSAEQVVTNSYIGGLSETAPATDTAASGLNGRLQRLAQRLTSILAKQPALGTAGSASTDVISVQGIASGTALAVSGTLAATQSGTWNITNISGTISLPTGAATAAKQPALGTAGTASTDVITVQGIASGTALNVSAVQSGTWNIGSITTLPALVAGTATIGGVIGIPTATGALSTSKTLSLGTTTPINVKNGAGQIYKILAFNTNAAARYLKLYNKATAPTVGTDVPVATLLIPGNTSGAGLNISFEYGMNFSTGIGFALTTGVADLDTGAVAANEIVVNILYI